MNENTLFNFINEISNPVNKDIFNARALNLNDIWRNHGGRKGWDNYRMAENENKLLDYIDLGFFRRENILLQDIKEIVFTAEQLVRYVDDSDVHVKIRESNQHGSSSKKIQDILIEYCEKLGFESEKEGLFKYHNLRPDYYKKLNTGGILLEVERGKTLTNNMDFYDLWKCHICEEANHLFLFVPQNVSHTKNIYETTFKRFSSFFREEKNHINIDTIFLFGY